MKTVKEIAQELLLNGEYINKGDFHAKYHTFTLTQRIEEIRKDGWNVKSRTIPGRKGMVEYWLEPEEINRIKSNVKNNASESVSARENKSDEQLLIENRKLAEQATESLKNEDEAYGFEQMGLGLLGGHNLEQRW